MIDDDKRLMDEYGITSEAKEIFHFEGHRYDRLSDAMSYAKIQRSVPKSAEPQDPI